jgi:hypothetical protein
LSRVNETFLNSQKAGKEKDGTKRNSLSDSESDDGKSKKKEMLLTNQEDLLEVLILNE